MEAIDGLDKTCFGELVRVKAWLTFKREWVLPSAAHILKKKREQEREIGDGEQLSWATLGKFSQGEQRNRVEDDNRG